MITAELRSRFAENDHEVLLSLSSLIFDHAPTDEVFERVSELYSLDVDMLRSEHQLYSHFKVGLQFKDMILRNYSFRHCIFLTKIHHHLKFFICCMTMKYFQ